jgi:hypothetical protein
MNQDISKLEWWMREGHIRSNRKGLLWKHFKDLDSASMTRTQLIKRVDEWSKAMKESRPSTMGKDSVKEYDVVKKRQHMESAGDDDNESPDAVSHFEEFEAQVLPALWEVSREYQAVRLGEILQMESDLTMGTAPTPGLVYVAKSSAIKAVKIGATRRSDPGPRLYELSRSVPSPFEWVYYVRTFTPFRLEAEVHSHFDACRIRQKGACTEFFDADADSIGAYLKSRFETVVERGVLV